MVRTSNSKQVSEWLAVLSKVDARLWLDGSRLQLRVPVSATLSSEVQKGVTAHLSKIKASSLLHRDSSCLVTLSDRRGCGNLICIHASHGDVFQYHHIAAELSSLRNVYGVQALGLLLAGTMSSSIDELIDLYVHELIESGLCTDDFVLYGVSAGGFLAMEIAHRLSALGRPPTSLVLGDTRTPSAWGATPALRQVSAARFLWLNFLNGYFPHSLLDTLRPFAERFWSLPTDEQKLEFVFEYLRLLPDPSYPVPARPDLMLGHLQHYSAYLQAFARYLPTRLYAGRSLYLRAARSNFDASASTRAMLTGDTRVEEISGTHMDMLQGPAAERIASIIDREFRGES